MNNIQREKPTPEGPRPLAEGGACGASKKEEYLLKKAEREREHSQKILQKKLKKILIIGIIIFLVGSGVFVLIKYAPKGGEKQEGPKITVFYSPTCACCKEYIPYLRRNGFEVEESKTQDILSIKEKYQIPSQMESCHTSIIGDYFIEGHVPVEAIKKLLTEKPGISGIALPGMPAGAPGMGGTKKESFEIHALTNGQMSEFMIVK